MTYTTHYGSGSALCGSKANLSEIITTTDVSKVTCKRCHQNIRRRLSAACVAEINQEQGAE